MTTEHSVPKDAAKGKGSRIESAETRFWSKVDVRAEDECWPWLAGTNQGGYGKFWLGGAFSGVKETSASRVAYLLTHGEVATGLDVCHECDNPPCCNPAHLFLGSHAENVADMIRKYRGNCLPGEGNFQAKLTDSQVAEIRRRYGDGEMQRTLAYEFGISQGSVSRLVLGKRRINRGYEPLPEEERRAVKLTPTQVREIRKRAQEGNSQTAIALEYGVSKSAINQIVRGVIWKAVV